MEVSSNHRNYAPGKHAMGENQCSLFSPEFNRSIHVEARAERWAWEWRILDHFKQPEAIALYTSSGYTPASPYGQHNDDEDISRFFTKDLPPPDRAAVVRP
jgi:hypothetical protein